jgi:hypothetical protein
MEDIETSDSECSVSTFTTEQQNALLADDEDGASTSTGTDGASQKGTGCLPRAYANVRAARKDMCTVRPLYGSEVLVNNDLGTFCNSNDIRVNLANHRHCYQTKANISTSFALDTLICNTCTFKGKHHMLWRETERPDTVDDSPIVFVLSDRCFPPVLPLEAAGECVKIMRIEDGGVMELRNAFIETTKGFVIPAGWVLVLFMWRQGFRRMLISFPISFLNSGTSRSTRGGSNWRIEREVQRAYIIINSL